MPRILSLPGFAQRYLPFLLALSLLALWLSLAPTALAEERAPAGRVLVTTGTVEAVAADGTVRKLRRRSQVYQGETVRTGDKGRTQVRFTDGALISIRPNTQVRVDEYRYENRDDTDRKFLTLNVGSFRTVTGRIGQTNRAAYRVSTPLAVIGIRGTDWEALQQPNGPLLLGVNSGGITAQSTNGNAADIGTGANFNYAQVSPDGNLQLLPEPPAALIEAGAVDQQPAEEGGDQGAGGQEQAAEGEGEAADGEGDAGDSGAAEGESGEVGADAPPTPPPPSGGGESSGGSADAGGDGGGSVAAPPPPPPPVVSINPSETGTGAPATTDPIIRVLTSAEEDLIVGGTQLALVSGMQINGSSGSQALLGLAGPDDDDLTPSFNFAFAGLTTVPTDRRAALNGANRIVQREGVAISGRTDNVGGISGLTFARYDASATTPLPVFTDPTLSTQFFNLTTPYVFAIFNPASVASLSGRLQYSPANSLISVSAGSVSTLVSDIVLNVNLGSGTVERGVLDIGFGSTPDALVFLTDFEGSLSNGVLNGLVTDIVLQDNGAAQTLGARGTIRGAFTGTGTTPALVLSFDFADTAGRNAFARGVIQYTGATAPPPPSLALSATEAAQVNTGYFFLAGQSDVDSGVAAGRASNAADTLGRPIFVSTNTVLSDGFAKPSDPVFGTLPPGLVARQGGAPTAGFVTGLTAPGLETVSLGRWLGTSVAPVEVRDATTGDIGEFVANTVFWATFQPKPRASLVGTALFSTGTTPTFLGEFGSSTGARVPLLGMRASMAVDFDTGVIRTGSLFLLTESGPSGDFGFDVGFAGNVVNGAGGAFAEMTTFGGAYRGRTPLNLAALEMTGAFTGTGTATGMLLQFHVESVPVGGVIDFAAGVATLGTFTDARVTGADVLAIDRVGIALFNPLDARGAPSGLPSNIGPGVILGYGGGVSPTNPSSYLIAANAYTSLDSFNQSGGPADFVVRTGGAATTNVAVDVGTNPVGPFAIGWGRWQVSPAAGGSAVVQDDAANAASQQVFSRDVLFASVRAAPLTATAGLGVANYSGNFTGPAGTTDLLAFGGAVGGPTSAFDIGNVNVTVDFNSGLVNGDLLVGSTTLDTDFAAQFNGRLNRNVADLTISALDVRVGTVTSPGDLANSSGVGVVTGPTGNQFLTGFQLVGGGQHVEGFVTSSTPAP